MSQVNLDVRSLCGKLVTDRSYECWGRFPRQEAVGAIEPETSAQLQQTISAAPGPLLARGMGRSYGDSCLNEGGYYILTEKLDAVRQFDQDNGVVRCESGISLDTILREFLPRGWFLPVSPGTKFVTVGGAIANDVHGKNHHIAGTFGNHVLGFELLRSDGTTIVCSPSENPDWYRATIGGLGLTGCILWADIQLKPVCGPYIDVESIRFRNLDEFADLSNEASTDYEYTVAWIDCITSGRGLGRGIFYQGNHSEKPEPSPTKALHNTPTWKNVPFDLPAFVLGKLSMRSFNFLYYHRHLQKRKTNTKHYDPFFYPLDGIRNWNRMYGGRGFLQWQCVVPFDAGYECVQEIVARIARSGLGSFLAVLKEFGNRPPHGLLSFPMPGITLALDLANVGPPLFRLLDQLDHLVINNGGRIYPAKDARMKPEVFRRSFEHLSEFEKFIDPNFSSSFYRRVVGKSNG